MILVKRKRDPSLTIDHLNYLGLERQTKKTKKSPIDDLNHLDLAYNPTDKENTITIHDRPVILYLGCANFIDALTSNVKIGYPMRWQQHSIHYEPLKPKQNTNEPK